MGRPRLVELDTVVLAAMACFREHGYDATSVRDLESATGLKAASLYNAFGSKAGLFNAVLERYRADVVDRRTSEHLRPELGLSGIRSFFVSTYTTEPLPSHGCLLTTSAVEFDVLDTDARETVKRGLAAIRDGFSAQLTAAQMAGELAASVDVDATSDLLLVLYEGMLAIARAGRAVSIDIERALASALAPLTSPTSSTGSP